MSGTWVIVCGPSGVGKDSVLSWAQGALAAHPRVFFSRRLVTRTGFFDETVSAGDLQALQAQGRLAWHWEANGLAYGVRSDYAQRVAEGGIVVVNGSREHARGVAGRTDVRCVLLAAGEAQLRERLLQRGREDALRVEERLARSKAMVPPRADRVIRNEGGVEAAGAALRDYLLELAR